VEQDDRSGHLHHPGVGCLIDGMNLTGSRPDR
jgi:hypothetical protein